MAIDPNVMNWDDVISNDAPEFVILPEGDYNFTVTSFERSRFPGSAKIPPCNKASMTLTFDNDQGVATARCDLLLYRTLEWKLCAFFKSIGQRMVGDKQQMDWNKVLGARGRAHVKPRSYTDKTGTERQANDVVRFLDPEPTTAFKPVNPPDLPWGNGF